MGGLAYNPKIEAFLFHFNMPPYKWTMYDRPAKKKISQLHYSIYYWLRTHFIVCIFCFMCEFGSFNFYFQNYTECINYLRVSSIL